MTVRIPMANGDKCVNTDSPITFTAKRMTAQRPYSI